ncbi:Gfo/Idh/MocA family protein [Paenibacillus marinisediminis]
MSIVRVGIIGTGFGLSVHAPLFNHHEGFEVRAIASVYRKDKLMESNTFAEARIYSDWKEMLDHEDLDLVTITSLPVLHHDMALYALSKGLHVLCEKPMAYNGDESSRMLESLRHANKLGFVNFQWRWLPVRQAIRSILDQKRLGTVQHIRYQGSFSGYQALTSTHLGWEGRKDQGGGMLFAVGSHMLDSLMWWMDQPIRNVYSLMETKVPHRIGELNAEVRDADDAFHVVGHFAEGASFSTELYNPAVRGTGWLLEIYGTQGTLIMTNDREIKVSYGGEFQAIEVENIEPPSALNSPAKDYFNGFHQMMNALHASITNGTNMPGLATFEDGHRVQQVLDAVRLSAEQHVRISCQ